MNEISTYNLLKRIIISVLIIFIASCNSTPTPEKENLEYTALEKQLRQSYNLYKNKVSKGNGVEVVKCVSSNTIRYYSSLLYMVNNADSLKLESADLLVKFSVLAIRHTLNWGMLRAMDGEKLFIYAIENGLIGRETSKTEIGAIKFKDDNNASGELVMNGKSTGIFTDFIKENGVWKVDLISLLRANELGLKKMIQQQNKTENQSIMFILKQTFGSEPEHEVWNPTNSNAK